MRYASTIPLASAACVLLLAHGASAQDVRRAEKLRGGNENPPVLTNGTGSFRADFFDDRIEFRLSYDIETRESDVTQAHLHIANPGINGGIVVFLCSNLGNEPADVTLRDCPPSPGEVEGEIVADDVLEAPDSALLAGDLEGLARLMKQGAVYVNIHSDDHPSGEVRGQLSPRER